MQYPFTPKENTTDILHNIPVSDPYRWMEDIDSSQTRAWIESQNQLTFSFLENIPVRQHLLQRMTRLWDFEKYSSPIQHGGRYFYTYNNGLQNQSALYWLASLNDSPQLLLDPNKLSADGTVALTDFAISDDGKLLAYGVSAAGSDWQEWRVRDIDTARDYLDHLQWVKFSGAAWTPDNLGFFYSRYDEPQAGQEYKIANSNQKLYYHRVGTSQANDELIYERPDYPEWGFNPSVTHDGRYLIVHVWKGTHREQAVYIKDLLQPGSAVQPLLPDFDAQYEYITSHDNRLYFYTDCGAPNARLISLNPQQPQILHWIEIIPQTSDALQNIHRCGDRLFATYLHDAYHQVKIFSLSGQMIEQISLPGFGSVQGFDGGPQDVETFYLFSGFLTPGTVYRYDLQTAQASIFRQPKVEFDSTPYTVEQIFYTSKDGTRIPMYLCHRKGLQRKGNNPTLLYGYGGFNIPVLPAFSVAAMVWMEMGGIYAVANLRGGGEYGKTWHQGGMLHNKQNVFDDFIAAAEWLISQNYTSQKKLAISGRSNGGLLVGACMTQRPDLFAACLPGVGVLDMLRFHKFTIGWAWVSDYGSPDDPEDFKFLLAYSPYHNVRPGTAYPPTLITTGDHDDRVFPAHSFKFAAALQSAQTGAAPILIRIDTKSGHGLGKPTQKLIEETVDQWAYVAHMLNVSF